MSETRSARPACVEMLEKRSLLSAAAATSEAPPVSAAQEGDVTPPLLVKEQLIGTDPRNVDGIVLTFNEPLDPESTQDLRTYRVGKRTDRRQNFNDFDIRRRDRGLVDFETPIYDPATFTVTLIAKDPFKIIRRFRTIRVLSREVVAIRDVAGNRLDGDENGRAGGDAVEQFTFRRSGRVSYGERDGDAVKLRLSGPGRMWVVRKTVDGDVLGAGAAVKVFIDDADSSSVLTGRVGGKGDNVAVIDELANPNGAQVAIASDPSFQILRSVS